MPHIIINCLKGRTQEQKKAIAEKFKKAAVEALGCDPIRVSVSIRDYDMKQWKPLYKKEILKDQEHVVIIPGYTYESLE